MLSHVFILIGQDSGSKVIPASLGTTQPQEKVVGSPPGQPTVQVEDSLPGFLMFSVIERKCHIPFYTVSPDALYAHKSAR